MIHLKGDPHLPSSIPNWGLGEFSDRRGTKRGESKCARPGAKVEESAPEAWRSCKDTLQ